MGGLRLAGVLWLVGGVFSALLVSVVLDTPAYAVLLAAGGVVGLVIGGLLVWRPSTTIIPWSSLAGLAWLVAFGWLTVTNLDQPAGEWLSVLVLTAFGVAGALVAFLRRGRSTVDGRQREGNFG